MGHFITKNLEIKKVNEKLTRRQQITERRKQQIPNQTTTFEPTQLPLIPPNVAPVHIPDLIFPASPPSPMSAPINEQFLINARARAVGYDRLLYLMSAGQIPLDFIYQADARIASALKQMKARLNGLTLMDFRSYIDNKSIALVANASVLLEGRFGAEIDAHDMVVRFNSYTLNNEHTGVKTHMHVSIHLQDINLDKFATIRFISAASTGKWINKINTIDRYKQSGFLKYHYHSDLLGGMAILREPLTSGFNTILLFKLLGNYSKMSLYGFDGYPQGEKSILRTPDGEALSISRNHNYAVEQKVLQETADVVDKKFHNYVYYGNRAL